MIGIARGLWLLLAAIFLSTVISGGFIPQDSAAAIHRWAGHALTIAVWLFVPFTMVIVLQQSLRHRPVSAIFQCLGLLLFLGIAIVAALTGYLAPTHHSPVDEESFNRFVVLHCYALPGAMGIALIGCFWCLRWPKKA